jgi:hypothetical protein
MNLLVVLTLGTRFQNVFLYWLSLFLVRHQQQPQLIDIWQAMERIRESGLRLLAGMMSQWQELMSFVYKSALLTYCMVARLLQLFFFQLALLAALLLFGNWFCFALDV